MNQTKLLCSILAFSMIFCLQAADLLKNPAINKIRIAAPANDNIIMIVNKRNATAAIVIPAAPQRKSTAKEKMQALEAAIAKRAAADMQKYIEAVTGAKLKIVTSDKPLPNGNIILIGDSHHTKKLGITASDLPLEGFRVKTFNKGVAIVGRMPDKRENFRSGVEYIAYTVHNSASLGLLFGVYDFLERFCGVRWYYPGKLGCYIPKRDTIMLPPCNYSDWPEFSKRTATIWKADKMEKDFALRKKSAEVFSPFFRAGDSSYIGWGCHSPRNFGIHRKKSPECFQLTKSGKRSDDYPCYGNPATIKLMLDDVKRCYEKNIKAPYLKKDGKTAWCAPTSERVVVSPPDKAISCNCKYCLKLIDKNAPYFRQANKLMAKFVNEFALGLKKAYPGKKVFYLPYSNYVKCPEGLKLPDNVRNFLCLTYGAGNYKENHVRKYSTQQINDWYGTNNKKVFLWEYGCWPANNTSMPYQYPHAIQKLYQDNRGRIGGSFINGGGQSKDDKTMGGEWAYFHPTFYCWFRLMWNNDFDIDAGLAEYCKLMYGPAEAQMKEIIAILMERWENLQWKKKIVYHHVDPAKIHRETMPVKYVKKLKALLARARKAAGENNIIRKRVDFFGTALEIFFRESDDFNSPLSLTQLDVMKVGDDPVIDGKLLDNCWKQAKEYNLKEAYKSRQLGHMLKRNRVKAVWTDNGITLGIRAFGKLPFKAKWNKRDEPIYEDESIELFIVPKADDYSFYQIVINPIGGVYDGKDRDGKFNFKKMKAKAYFRNDCNWWCAEIFIPFSELGISPEIGLEMKGNIVRSQIQDKKRWVFRFNTKCRASHADPNAFGIIKLVE